MRRLSLPLIAAAVIALSPAASWAQIVTNLTTGTSGAGSTLSFFYKAFGITPVASPYSFTSLRAPFNNNTGGLSAGQITGGIYSNAAGNPGSLLASFNTVSVPVGAAGLIGMFTLSSAFTLGAGSSYWFVLRDLDGGSLTNWINTDAAPTAVAGVSTIGYRTSTDSGATWTTSAIMNRIEINATPVPEPAAAMLWLGGLLVVASAAAGRRHRH